MTDPQTLCRSYRERQRDEQGFSYGIRHTLMVAEREELRARDTIRTPFSVSLAISLHRASYPHKETAKPASDVLTGLFK
jgi:hypothetical protein